MNRMIRSEFAQEMTRLRAKYSQQVHSQDDWTAMLVSYADLTEQFPREQLLPMFRAIHESYPKFFPGCGEMAQFIRMTRPGPTEAWPEVLQLASRSGGEHSDPLAQETVRLMGGFKRLGQMNAEELAVWGRKRFEQIYAELAEKRRFVEDRLSLGDGSPTGNASGVVGALAGKLSME